MARANKRKPKKRRTTRRKTTSKKRLVGFTKTKGRFALVFKKGNKLSVGSGRFKSKKTLMLKARRFLKK